MSSATGRIAPVARSIIHLGLDVPKESITIAIFERVLTSAIGRIIAVAMDQAAPNGRGGERGREKAASSGPSRCHIIVIDAALAVRWPAASLRCEVPAADLAEARGEEQRD
jgi:hypothetical protein